MKKAASVRWQRSKRLNDVGPFYLERGMIFGKVHARSSPLYRLLAAGRQFRYSSVTSECLHRHFGIDLPGLLRSPFVNERAFKRVTGAVAVGVWGAGNKQR